VFIAIGVALISLAPVRQAREGASTATAWH
jgi:hypothetical protein